MTEEHFFPLSPAKLKGKRGRMLFNLEARFELAQEVRSRDGAALGGVYSFLSDLYWGVAKVCAVGGLAADGAPKAQNLKRPGVARALL